MDELILNCACDCGACDTCGDDKKTENGTDVITEETEGEKIEKEEETE